MRQSKFFPFDLPQNIVDTDDALRLQVACVVDNCSLGFQPHIATMFGKHAVLSSDHLAFGTH